MDSRLTLRRSLPALVGLVLCALGVLPPLLEHHPLDHDTYPGAARSAVSVAATHAGAKEHCEASTTETHESCVVCLLHRRIAGGHLPELLLVEQADATRQAGGPAELFPRSSLLPPAGGRAPPEV
jgi:hypothetical protein